MIEKLQDLVNGNPGLVRRGKWTNAVMLLGIGNANWIITIRAGQIEAIAPEGWTVSPYDFAIRGTEEAWEKFWSPLPPPMHHDISALVRAGKVRMDGDIDMLLANFLYLKLVLEQLRGHYAPEAA
ncbi:MAG: hypothetical protein AAF557_15260 [Pseudomonadota bacterium]